MPALSALSDRARESQGSTDIVGFLNFDELFLRTLFLTRIGMILLCELYASAIDKHDDHCSSNRGNVLDNNSS